MFSSTRQLAIDLLILLFRPGVRGSFLSQLFFFIFGLNSMNGRTSLIIRRFASSGIYTSVALPQGVRIDWTA